jgi:orotidine 5'-phosphate decarboxylase subfamily 1
MSYSERAKLCQNPIAKKLFEIVETKKSNLCLAADVTTKAELLKIADELGPYICLFKTHIDIIDDFDTDLITQLQRLSEKHNFLIFEDRKFADIGNTVAHQYEGGIYHIADWAHIINAHTVPGPGIIAGLKKIGLPKNRALILIAEMSSEGTLATDDYQAATLKMAEVNKDFVIGFITTKKMLPDPVFISFTPGVKLENGVDALGQQYLTPEKVIMENNSDIIIVGRGIYEAADPISEAKKYQSAGWAAYEKKLV